MEASRAEVRVDRMISYVNISGVEWEKENREVDEPEARLWCIDFTS